LKWRIYNSRTEDESIAMLMKIHRELENAAVIHCIHIYINSCLKNEMRVNKRDNGYAGMNTII